MYIVDEQYPVVRANGLLLNLNILDPTENYPEITSPTSTQKSCMFGEPLNILLSAPTPRSLLPP